MKTTPPKDFSKLRTFYIFVIRLVDWTGIKTINHIIIFENDTNKGNFSKLRIFYIFIIRLVDQTGIKTVSYKEYFS